MRWLVVGYLRERGTYCDGANCRTPGDLGAACWDDLLADPAQCHSGFCDRGRCGNSVLALCGSSRL